ncbi:hypothetical protein PInf_017761 [Phytophthora infestans]|nr:hypothetical protein PInf_017761 [Phytophthora infestans]
MNEGKTAQTVTDTSNDAETTCQENEGEYSGVSSKPLASMPSGETANDVQTWGLKGRQVAHHRYMLYSGEYLVEAHCSLETTLSANIAVKGRLNVELHLMASHRGQARLKTLEGVIIGPIKALGHPVTGW